MNTLKSGEKLKNSQKGEPVNTDSLILFVTLKFSDYLSLIARTSHEALRTMFVECTSDTVVWTDRVAVLLKYCKG